MAERQPNFLTDTLLPLYAFVSGASGNRSAAHGAAGLARILKQHTGRTGAGRQAGDPVENAFAEARTRQPIQTQSTKQQFQGQRLGDVMGLLGQPMTTGDPLTGGLQGPEGPRAPTSRERGERLGTLPLGLLTAAGLGDTEKAIASREVDPRQFALDKRSLLGALAKLSPEQLSPENRKQAMAMIGRAKDQENLSQAFVEAMRLAGADPGSPEEQAFREGRSSGLTAVESIGRIAEAKREPQDPLIQQKRRLEIQDLQSELDQKQLSPLGLSRADQIKLQSDTRKQITSEPVYKDYQAVQSGFATVKTGADRNDGIGDVAIVNGIVRMLDPGSVVRPSEVASQMTAQGLLEYAKSWQNRIQQGDVLGPEARKRFLEMAGDLQASYRNRAVEEIGRSYGTILQGTGLPINSLFVQPSGVEPGPEASPRLEPSVAPQPSPSQPASTGTDLSQFSTEQLLQMRQQRLQQ